MTSTPARYQADPPKYEDKAWLYEQYWNQLRSTEAISNDCGVHRDTINVALARHGIPRRPSHYERSTESPIAGFYGAGEVPGETDTVDWTALEVSDD